MNQSLSTFIRFGILNATTTTGLPLWRTPNAITVTALHGVCISGAANATLAECDANGANCAVVDSSWMNISATNVNDDNSLSNPSIDANDWVGVMINNLTANITTLSFSFEYTNN